MLLRPGHINKLPMNGRYRRRLQCHRRGLPKYGHQERPWLHGADTRHCSDKFVRLLACSQEGSSFPACHGRPPYHVGRHRGALTREEGEGSGSARSIPADIRAGEMHTAVCFAPAPHGQLRGPGRRARPVRVLSARSGAGRCRVGTAGDVEDGDDEGRADSGNGSRPFPVERRMPFLTLTVLAAFA